MDNTEGLSDVTADVSRTASIIGVEITDPGINVISRLLLLSVLKIHVDKDMVQLEELLLIMIQIQILMVRLSV